MSKVLGSLTLPDQIEWSDRYEWAGVDQAAERTLAGTLVLWAQPLSRGRPITLVAADSVCWLDQAAVDALQAMAAEAGAVFPLTWDSETHDVMFAHHAGNPIQFSPLWPHYPLYTGQINLIEI